VRCESTAIPQRSRSARNAREADEVRALLLAVPLVLGHACELWALTGIVHVHETAHHASDHHHPDESQVACDAMVGVPSNIGGHPDALPALDAATALRLVVPEPSLIAVARWQASHGPPRRLPLFLLHASLLI